MRPSQRDGHNETDESWPPSPGRSLQHMACTSPHCPCRRTCPSHTAAVSRCGPRSTSPLGTAHSRQPPCCPWRLRTCRPRIASAPPTAAQMLPAEQVPTFRTPSGPCRLGTSRAGGAFLSVPASGALLPAPHNVGYVAPSEQELPAVQLSHPSRLRPVKSPKLPAAHGFATVEPASQ